MYDQTRAVIPTRVRFCGTVEKKKKEQNEKEKKTMIKDRTRDRVSRETSKDESEREEEKEERKKRESRVLAYITNLRGSDLAEGATRESPFVLAAAK